MARLGIEWRSAGPTAGCSAARRGTLRAAAVAAAVLAAGAGFLGTRSTAALAAPPPPPPLFTQCPPNVGVDKNCALLVVIQPNGSLTILSDPGQGPFDGSDDTLLGVQNNSAITVPSISIGSSGPGAQAVFGFEGDGLCKFVFTGSAYCNVVPKPPTGYEGPDTRFSNISANKHDGTVNFTDPGGGLAAGASTYFSLEYKVDPTKLGTGAATTMVFSPTSASTSDNADAVTVAATLMAGPAPVPNAQVIFTLAPGPQSVSCSATTDALGVASCALVPHHQAGVYQVTASYAGSSVPLLAPVDTNAPFTVTLEQDLLVYRGPTSGTAGQPLILSGILTTDDPSPGTPLSGETVTFTFASGPNARTCNGITNASGEAGCSVIVSPSQTTATVATSAVLVSDGFYAAAAAAGTVAVAGTAPPTPEVGAAGGPPAAPAALLILAGGCVVAAAGRRRRSR